MLKADCTMLQEQTRTPPLMVLLIVLGEARRHCSETVYIRHRWRMQWADTAMADAGTHRLAGPCCWHPRFHDRRMLAEAVRALNTGMTPGNMMAFGVWDYRMESSILVAALERMGIQRGASLLWAATWAYMI